VAGSKPAGKRVKPSSLALTQNYAQSKARLCPINRLHAGKGKRRRGSASKAISAWVEAGGFDVQSDQWRRRQVLRNPLQVGRSRYQADRGTFVVSVVYRVIVIRFFDSRSAALRY
jgi:hypothetical protein